MDPLRFLLVDDSALFRTLLRNAINELPDCTVIGTASDGSQAIQQCLALKPDVVTLDVEMPGMSGLDVLQRLIEEQLDIKVIMLSRLTMAGAQVTSDALLHGAFDFIPKPNGKNPSENKSWIVAELREKVAAIRTASPSWTEWNQTQPFVPTATAHPTRNTSRTPIECVVIGSSTGGPDALAHIVPYLPAIIPAPIIIVQHMPEGFTRSLARRLDEASEIEIVEAEDGMPLRNGTALLAPGGKHLRLWTGSDRLVRIELNDDPKEHNCRPAIDYTLRSAVKIYGSRLLSIILTGMGRDGTEGCRVAASHGALVMAQAPQGCVVYGMPKSVIEAGLTDQVVALSDIPEAIISAVNG